MRMPTLDLKVLAHHGTIVRQRMAGREELVGSDVILVHRLLKNAVTERTGATAYALYTQRLPRGRRRRPESLGLVEHRETYDHIGEVVGWVADLGAAWTAEQERTRVVVEPAAAMATIEFDLPAPPAVTWEYLTSPARRTRWQAGVTEVIEQTAGGRRGVGTTNHCVHGKDAIVEEILDWRPPEYYTMRWQMPIPNAPKVRSTDTLTRPPGDPRHDAHRTAAAGQGSCLPRGHAAQLGPMFQAGVEALRPLLEAEMARRARRRQREPGAGAAELGRPIPAGPVDPRVRPFVVMKRTGRRPAGTTEETDDAVRAADLRPGTVRGRPRRMSWPPSSPNMRSSPATFGSAA